MIKYRNIFKEKTENELVELYKEFIDFEKNGVIADNTELSEIHSQYSEWFENPMDKVIRDLLHSISDFWFKSEKPYSDKKRYRYNIAFDSGEGFFTGTIVLTEEEARIVDYAMETDHWDDFYSPLYSAYGSIDLENPMEIQSSTKDNQ